MSHKDSLNQMFDAVADELLRLFKDKQLPTRVDLRRLLVKRHPHLDYPKLDLELGRMLNWLVDTGTLQRVQGKYYAPGDKYLTPIKE